MSQVNNISSLLNSLDQANNQNQKPIFVPTLNRKVNFKLLTAAQHKSILTTIMDQSNAGISLSLLLNQIIKDNICEKVLISSLDRIYILIALRAYSLSSTYERNNNTIDLHHLLLNEVPLHVAPVQIKEDKFTIHISAPSILKDSQINRESKRRLEDNKSSDNISKIALDEIYTNEFVKYIDSIDFESETGISSVEFTDLTHSQKRSVVDKLAATTETKLLTEINKYKEQSEQFLKIDNVKIEVSIDQAFFTI